ncbi:MAG: tetratricopeptide repeat protein [Halanaerobium sp.]
MRKLLIFLLLIVLLLNFNLNIKAESNYNWQQLIKTTNEQLKSDSSDIMLNYTLAVAYANTGEIKKAYDIIDVFGSSVSREDFNAAVSLYLTDWESYIEKDNLLLLNYAAFADVINKDYSDAVDLFKYIIEIDPDNLWVYNHAAAAMIELKRYDEALEYANTALRMEDNEYSHLIKGVVYYENGNYFRALLEAASSRRLFKALAEDEYNDFVDDNE